MSDKNITKHLARLRRKKHIRKKIYGNPEKPRLVVYRSLKNIYAQLVDDDEGVTLAASSSIESAVKERIKESKSNLETSLIVGQSLGEKARAKGISQVVFDRNGYHYHGRVKAVADGARKAGLEF